MSYFDDMEIHSVMTVTTSFNRNPDHHSMAAIGIMEKDPVFRIAGEKKIRLETPFLYWSRSGEKGAWYSPPGSVRKNTWLLGRGERLERMIQSLDNLSGGENTIFLKNPAPIANVFERMLAVFKENCLHSGIQLALLAEELMSVIEKTVMGKDVSPRLAEGVQEIAEAICRNPGGSYDFEKDARNLSVSELYFRRCFTQYAGMAPHAFLLRQRYLLAVRLLRETDLRIQEIAERCGFPVPRIFSMFFRQRAGMSPRDFRNTPY